MSALDLNTPLPITLTIAAVAWGTLGIICLLACRRQERGIRDQVSTAVRRGARRVRTFADWVCSGARDRGGLCPVDDGSTSGARHEPGRDWVGHSTEVRGQQGLNDAERVRPLPRLDLTDDELVALARYLNNPSAPYVHVGHGRALVLRAFDKIEHAAERVNAR